MCDKCTKSGSGGGSDSDEGAKKTPKSGAGAKSAAPAPSSSEPVARRPAPGLPLIRMEDAIRALGEFPFAGRWEMMLTFHVVELGPDGAGGTGSDEGQIAAGARLYVELDLETKGAAYFKGTIKNFGPFGTEGKVTGALQRGAGKVTMTISVVNVDSRITTTFNCQGMMNGEGMFMGAFSGCEISKSAGAISGIFKGRRNDAIASGSDEDEEDDESKGSRSGSGSVSESSSDSDTDADAKKKRDKGGKAKNASAAASKKKKAATSNSDSDSDSSAPKKKPAVAKVPPKKKAVSSSDDSDSPPPKVCVCVSVCLCVCVSVSALPLPSLPSSQKLAAKATSKKKATSSDDGSDTPPTKVCFWTRKMHLGLHISSTTCPL